MRSTLERARIHSAQVETRLRRYLTEPGEYASSSGVLIRRLLWHSQRAKATLFALMVSLRYTTAGNQRARSDLETQARLLYDLLSYREPHRNDPLNPTGPSLNGAQEDFGTFAWEGTIAERTYDELARLLYLASARPKGVDFEITNEERANGLAAERVGEIGSLLTQVVASATSEYQKFSRDTSKAMWDFVLELSTATSPVKVEIRTLTPSVLHHAMLKSKEEMQLIEKYARGEFAVKAPILNQEVTWRVARTIMPYISGVLLFLAGLSLEACARRAVKISDGSLWRIEPSLPLIAELGLRVQRVPLQIGAEAILILLPAFIAAAVYDFEASLSLGGLFALAVGTGILFYRWLTLRGLAGTLAALFRRLTTRLRESRSVSL